MGERYGNLSKDDVDRMFEDFIADEVIVIAERPYERYDLDKIGEEIGNVTAELIERGELKTARTKKGGLLRAKLIELNEEARIKCHE